jgi:signal peptidase I
MLPTIKNNQIVIGVKSDNFEVNDIIVAQVEGDYIIKRIKFKEGDEIFYHFDKFNNLPSLINKTEFDRELNSKKHYVLQKISVPNNRFYLLGDNLPASDDSRRFGLLDKDNLKYKIIFPRF